MSLVSYTCHTTTPPTNKNHQRAASRRVSQNKSPTNPTSFQTELSGTQKFRFVYEKAEPLSYYLTDVDLVELMLFNSGPGSYYRVFDSVKLHSVELFTTSSTNVLHTVSLEWQRVYPFGSKTQTISDTGTGVTEPAHVRATPPKDSYAHTWLSPDATPKNLCLLNLPFLTIVDITVSYVLNVNSAGVAAQYSAGASVPAGTMFVPTIYGVLIPQSVNK